MDATDCGPACLQMILEHYGRHVSLQVLRERCHIGKDGVSFQEIANVAEMYGLEAEAFEATPKQFYDEARLPVIAHWKGNHFVVIHSVESGRKGITLQVADPGIGDSPMLEKEFLDSWLTPNGTGLLMQFSDAGFNSKVDDMEEFLDKETRRHGLTYILEYIKPHYRQLTGILLCMILTCICAFVVPFISQGVVDRGVGEGNRKLVEVFLLSQMLLITGSLAGNVIRGRLSLTATTQIGIKMISDFIGKLMSLPLRFFESKHTGDILQRIADHTRIQNFLTGSFVGTIVSILLVFIYSVVVGIYNVRILIVFLIGTLLQLAWALAFIQKRRRLDIERFRESAANQGSIFQIVGAIPDIKLNGCAGLLRNEWEKIQYRLFAVNTRRLSINQAQGYGASFIEQGKNILISFIAAMAVIDGKMTLGMMMALQFVAGQMTAPLQQIIDFFQSAQDASMSMERLGEIRDLKEEESGHVSRPVFPSAADISFRGVSFSYDGAVNVLKDINAVFPSGKVTAVVGASGSGKTTMVKLMLGFYQPTAGDVMYDETPVNGYSLRELRSRCGVNMQESYIFNGTIAYNIGISDEQPDQERVRKAARAVLLDDWVMSLPLGYETKIGLDGMSLSSGQKQRLFLARAIYRCPDYLFLDEATNALDAKNEKSVIENISELFRGKTVIIIAHRLSTVKDADNIIVLNEGRIVESGRHQQLIDNKGYYYSLVMNQLELGSD